MRDSHISAFATPTLVRMLHSVTSGRLRAQGGGTLLSLPRGCNSASTDDDVQRKAAGTVMTDLLLNATKSDGGGRCQPDAKWGEEARTASLEDAATDRRMRGDCITD